MSNNHFQTGQQAVQNCDPWEKKNNVSHTTTPTFCRESISRPPSTGKGNPNWTWEPCWENEDQSSGRLGWLKLQGRALEKGKLSRKSSRNVLSSRPYMCEWNSTRQGKKWPRNYKLIQKFTQSRKTFKHQCSEWLMGGIFSNDLPPLLPQRTGLLNRTEPFLEWRPDLSLKTGPSEIRQICKELNWFTKTKCNVP